MSEEILSTEPQHGVFYTDGGCRSNEPKNPASRGQAGWGLHGFIYTNETPKVGAGAKKGVPSKSGYDLKGTGKGEVTVQKYVDAFVSIPGIGTNQIAELMGAIAAVDLAIKHNLASVTVITDSLYVVKGSTEYMAKWKANGWTKQDRTTVANQPIWAELDAKLTLYKDNGGKFDAVWVKGHNGDPGNTLADRYATRAVLAYQQGNPLNVISEADPKGYWKPKYDRNRMLCHANWYFTTSGDMDVIAPDGRFIYYLGDIRDSEDFTGKRISDAAFAVVYLKEPEIVLDQLFRHFVDLSKGSMQGLISADLKVIFHHDIYEALNRFGDSLLVLNRQRQSIEHTDKLKEDDNELPVLAHEIRPTRRSYSAVGVLESLEVVLNHFLTPKEGSRQVATDVTDVIYEQQESKSKTTVKLSSKVSTTKPSIDVAIRIPQWGEDKLFTVCLTLGQDLPDRNTLSALAVEGVSVHVVAWPESPVAFRFATIVQAQGDTGIYSGPYANLQLIERPE